MGLLAPIASLLGIEAGALIQRLKEDAVAVAAIGIFALIGLTFLLVAAYTGLTWWVGPLWAPLIIAAAAFAIAVIVFIALRIQQAAVARRNAEKKRQLETTALMASAALGALPELLGNSVVRNVGLPIAIYAAFLLLTRPGRPRSGPHDPADNSEL